MNPHSVWYVLQVEEWFEGYAQLLCKTFTKVNADGVLLQTLLTTKAMETRNTMLWKTGLSWLKNSRSKHTQQ